MIFQKLSIPDVVLIEAPIFEDDRGFFRETFHSKKFEHAGLRTNFVQDNHSYSVKGVLRGLHYQINQPQGKLINVIKGTIFDVAVDLRRSSPTFGDWVGEYLTEENKHQLWVPEGFAHGFLVLSESAHVVYKCTDSYAPSYERTILWNDPEVGIEWPLMGIKGPLLAKKDLSGSSLAMAEVFS